MKNKFTLATATRRWFAVASMALLAACSKPSPLTKVIVLGRQHHAAWVQTIIHPGDGKYTHTWVQTIYHPERWEVTVSGRDTNGIYVSRTLSVSVVQFEAATNRAVWPDIP